MRINIMNAQLSPRQIQHEASCAASLITISMEDSLHWLGKQLASQHRLKNILEEPVRTQTIFDINLALSRTVLLEIQYGQTFSFYIIDLCQHHRPKATIDKNSPGQLRHLQVHQPHLHRQTWHEESTSTTLRRTSQQVDIVINMLGQLQAILSTGGGMHPTFSHRDLQSQVLNGTFAISIIYLEND